MAHIIRQWMGAGFGTTYSFDAMDPFRAMWRTEQIGDIRAASRITSSPDLPGSTHWDPQSVVPVGDKDIGGPVLAAVIAAARAEVPAVVFGRDPDFVNEGHPPVVFAPVPVLLPGQVDPAREEHETVPGPTPTNEEIDVAIDWGGAFSAGIDLLQGQNIGGGLPAAYAAPAGFVAAGGGAAPPAKVTVDTATGKVTPCRRRRRKPLLTDADFAALAKVASLPNNANVRTALAQAIRR